eukprot:TRINITY_DN6730_c1_g2_i1.p1 TRINITY_DN6730_c1_g2~~TRINITY_DN6730_c1_g2_i1.p1  ORF type:complete len:737 (+),score=95.58 TRINITY_DN6730_c1_g2_i1:106-2316(+)
MTNVATPVAWPYSPGNPESDRRHGTMSPVCDLFEDRANDKAIDCCVATAQLLVGNCMRDIMGYVDEQSRRLQMELAMKLHREVYSAHDVRPALNGRLGSKSDFVIPGTPAVRDNPHQADDTECTVDVITARLKREVFAEIAEAKETSRLGPRVISHERAWEEEGTVKDRSPLCWVRAPHPTDCDRPDEANVKMNWRKKGRGTRIFGFGRFSNHVGLDDFENNGDSAAPAMGKAVFANATEMKEKVRNALRKDKYSVFDRYHTEGIFQMIGRSTAFENMTLLVIAINAVWIAVDTDFNDADTLLHAQLPFVIADNWFCAYFTAEIIVRFGAFVNKLHALQDGWFVFDSVMAFTMIVETWVVTGVMHFSTAPGSSSGSAFGNTSVVKIVRLARLTRMARLVRLLRAVPELIILIKGILVASRSVFFTLLLLLLIMYVFAIVFRQVVMQFLSPDEAAHVIDTYFRSVPHSMFALLVYAVIPDSADIILACAEAHVLLGIVIVSFVLLATLTVMNMLVGVLCEVVSVVSSVEKEELTVSYVKGQLMEMLSDDMGNDTITKEAFENMLMSPKAARAMDEIGVDVVGLADLSDYLFQDGIEISFSDLIELVLQLRGSNVSTVRDLVDLRRYMHKELADIQSNIMLITPQSERAEEVGCSRRPSVAVGLNEKRATRAVTSTPMKTCGSSPSLMPPACQVLAPFSGCPPLREDVDRNHSGLAARNRELNRVHFLIDSDLIEESV